MAKLTEDQILLKQKLLHVKSELKMKENELTKIKQSYDYQLINQLKDEINQFEEDQKELKEHLYSLESKLLYYKRQLDVANIKLNMYQQALENKELDYQKIKKELDENKNKCLQLSNQFLVVKSKEDQLKTELKQKNSMISDLQKSQTQKSRDLTRLEVNYQTLENRQSELNTKLHIKKEQYHRVYTLFRHHLISQFAREIISIRDSKMRTDTKGRAREVLLFEIEKRLNELSQEIDQLENKD